MTTSDNRGVSTTEELMALMNNREIHSPETIETERYLLRVIRAADYVREMHELARSLDHSELLHHAGHVVSEMESVSALVLAKRDVTPEQFEQHIASTEALHTQIEKLRADVEAERIQKESLRDALASLTRVVNQAHDWAVQFCQVVGDDADKPLLELLPSVELECNAEHERAVQAETQLSKALVLLREIRDNRGSPADEGPLGTSFRVHALYWHGIDKLLAPPQPSVPSGDVVRNQPATKRGSEGAAEQCQAVDEFSKKLIYSLRQVIERLERP